MTEDSSNRFENLLGKINQLPEDQRQRPRDYLDQDSLWRERDQEMKELFSKHPLPRRNSEPRFPPETDTVKMLRTKLAALIAARYKRYHSPAKIRHPRASNWDVPGAESSSWQDLAESLAKLGSSILGVKMLGLRLNRDPRTFPGIDLEIDCTIDGELQLFSWGYSTRRKNLFYDPYGREKRLPDGVHVVPDITELKKKLII